MRWLRPVAVVALAGVLLAPASAVHARGPEPGNGAEIALAQLPREARDTLALVKKGGPFPYDRDGIAFGNFEGRLPRQARGYYREYTVETPGLTHRGARRIIAACGKAALKAPAGGRFLAPCDVGEYYYTEDHYNSFRRIRE